MWGGDACVALEGGGRLSRNQDGGDASVPSPHNPTPAPTGTKALPGVIIKNLPAQGWMCGEGTLASPMRGGTRRLGDWDEGDASVPTHLSRHPRPYGDEGAS